MFIIGSGIGDKHQSLLGRDQLAATGEVVPVQCNGMSVDEQGRFTLHDRKDALVQWAARPVAFACDRFALDIGIRRSCDDAPVAVGCVAYDDPMSFHDAMRVTLPGPNMPGQAGIRQGHRFAVMSHTVCVGGLNGAANVANPPGSLTSFANARRGGPDCLSYSS